MKPVSKVRTLALGHQILMNPLRAQARVQLGSNPRPMQITEAGPTGFGLQRNALRAICDLKKPTRVLPTRPWVPKAPGGGAELGIGAFIRLSAPGCSGIFDA